MRNTEKTVLHHDVKSVFIQEIAINSEFIDSFNKFGGHERIWYMQLYCLKTS
jgi:hypothetical protein